MAALSHFVGPSSRVEAFLRRRGLDRFAVGECIEVLACPAPRRGWRSEDMEVSAAAEPFRVAPAIGLDRLIGRYQQRHPNEFSGSKWAFRDIQGGLRDDAGGRVRVTLARTNWLEVRSIQEPLLLGSAESEEIRKVCGAAPLQPESSPIPSIGVVHATVLTADDHLVMAQRSRHVAYFPETWSLSFEEQLSDEDLSAGNAITAAAARGANEELAASESLVRAGDVTVLSFFLEHYNLNLAACAVVRVPLAFKELRTRWREAHPDPEFSALEAMRFTSGDLPKLARRALEDHASWHPSSRYRLLKTMIHAFGYDATVGAFEAASRGGRSAAQRPA